MQGLRNKKQQGGPFYKIFLVNTLVVVVYFVRVTSI